MSKWVGPWGRPVDAFEVPGIHRQFAVTVSTLRQRPVSTTTPMSLPLAR
jgi:hypothetical protein